MSKSKIKLSGFIVVVIAFALALCGCHHAEDHAVSTPVDDIDPITRVYIAGPFFNDEERANVEYVESVLDDKGIEYFSPMRHDVDYEFGTTEWQYAVYEVDRSEIANADAVVALYYGNYSDSGTAWECGYATAIGVPVILVHVNEGDNANVMMLCSSVTDIYLEDLASYDFNDLPVIEYEGASI